MHKSKDRTIEELREEKNRLEKIIASLGDAVSIHDLNFKITYQNQSIKDLSGDHVGEYCYKAYHHKDEVCDNCPVSKTLIDGMVHSAVRDLITDDGKLYMEIIASPLKNVHGEITGSIEVARNITARRQAEEELHLYREIVSNIAEGVYLIRANDGMILYANPKFEKMFGYDPGELTGKHVSTINAPADNSMSKETANEIMKVLTEKRTWSGEVRSIRKGGTSFLCYASVATFEHHLYGTVWIAIHQDITDRKRAERELLVSKQMLEDITQGITDSILLLSNDLKIQWANKATLQQTGLSMKELSGCFCYKATHHRDCPCEPPNDPCPATELLKTGNPVTLEHTHYDKGGKALAVEVSAYPVINHNGEAVKFVHVTKDITERKRLEQALVEKNEKLLEINSELHTLYQISQAISRTIDLDKLLLEVLEAITDIKIFKLIHKGAIFIVDGNRMRLVASIGLSETMHKLHKGMMVGDCLCGLAAATGGIILSKRSDADKRHTINDLESPLHGHIIVPLKAANKVGGVLCLYLPADIHIDEREINLLNSIAGQIGTAIENAKLYEETRSLSLHDHLTGLANRRFMQIQLENNFSVAKRYRKNLSIIMLDIDHFKKYNDTNGHSEGDRLLVAIAKIMANNMREADNVFRYGGEEFMIMLPETDMPMAAEVAERIRTSVAEATDVSASLGVSCYQDYMQTYDQLIDKADNALYRAKHKGRNRVEVAPLQ